MRIGINFGDSDFYNCFAGVLLTILQAYNWTGGSVSEIKKDLASIINEISYGCYILFQQYRHGDEIKEDKIRIKKYLQITEDKILINEEIDEYIEDQPEQLNGELFVLDTRLDYPGNSPVYFV